MFGKIATVIILVLLYHNLTPENKVQVQEIGKQAAQGAIFVISELKREGNHSTKATDETYCPTDHHKEIYGNPYQHYDPNFDGPYSEYIKNN